MTDSLQDVVADMRADVLMFSDHAVRDAIREWADRLSALAAPVVSDEMVERACKRYAFREDGAVFPDDYSEHEVAAERHLMREFLEHTLALSPGRSGAVDRG